MMDTPSPILTRQLVALQKRSLHSNNSNGTLNYKHIEEKAAEEGEKAEEGDTDSGNGDSEEQKIFEAAFMDVHDNNKK